MLPTVSRRSTAVLAPNAFGHPPRRNSLTPRPSLRRNRVRRVTPSEYPTCAATWSTLALPVRKRWTACSTRKSWKYDRGVLPKTLCSRRAKVRSLVPAALAASAGEALLFLAAFYVPLTLTNGALVLAFGGVGRLGPRAARTLGGASAVAFLVSRPADSVPPGPPAPDCARG